MKFDLRIKKHKEIADNSIDDTKWSKRNVSERIKDVSRAITDIDKNHRVNYGECIACYYFSSHMGGSALTPYTCKLCGESNMNSNTNCPVFCSQCATDNDICCRCGSRMYEKYEINLE